MRNPILDLIKPFARRDLSLTRELITSETGRSIDIHAQDNSGTTVLHWAVRRWYIELAKLALQKGANPNLKDNEGNSSLHIASMTGGSNITLFELLLKYEADINSRNVGDYTPLHLVAENGHIEGAIMVIKRGADVNALTKYSTSVLSYALKKLQREVQNGNEYLIDRCAQIVELLKLSWAKE